MSAAVQYHPDPAARAIGHMLNIRAELSTRRGREATAKADAWHDLPKAFKVYALKAARLDPLRECMPLDTFDAYERHQLRDAADRLLELAAQLRRAGT